MKILVIDTDNVGLSFCWRCVMAGHTVRWFVKPKKCNNPATGRGFKGIEKIQNWVGSVMWADLVFATSNDDYIDRLEFFKKKGAKVFAPSVASANLEISRADGMKLLEKVGIETAPYKTFKSMAEAEAYVKKTEERFVFKTLGDNEDKSLTYCSKSPADMVNWLQRQQKNGPAIKGDVMLQTFINGTEFGVSRWIGKDGWVGQYNESFEHKKLMSSNYGPNCYSDDSEVLTESGWKFWPNVTQEDKICTLRDGYVTFDEPSQLVSADYEGELIGWESPYVDILVTPGHNMYVQDDNSRKEFWFEPAGDTEGFSRNILRGAGVWSGVDNLEAIPSFYKGSFSAWCALIGACIADGYSKNRSVAFGNCPVHKQAIFTAIAEAAGFSAKMYGPDLYINSKNLADYVREFGKAADKFAPHYVKTSSIEAIRSFLFGYGAGDGTTRENNLVYSTVSKNLANDLQELVLKAGWCANVKVRDRRGYGHEINGHVCINNHLSYEISVSKQRLKANLSPQISYRQPYKGKVYCCTVPSHIIYVRRNGKSCFLGQTGEMGTVAGFVPESKIGKETLGKLEEELVKLGHLGDTALGFMIDDTGKPWPTEWTCRPGWPIFNMMLGSIKEDPAQWMVAAMEGKDTTSFHEEIGVCLVVAQPEFPYGGADPKQTEGVPIYGVTKGNKKHLHPQAVKIDVLADMDGSKIVDRPIWNTCGDYNLVVTGYGKDVRQAAGRAYKTAKQLHISNMILRDDIGEDLESQLPDLHKLGYALHFEYDNKDKP